MITMKKVFTAFRIYPALAYHLECAGILPERPRGVVTLEYVEAMTKHFTRTRGAVPEAVKEILAEMRQQHQPEEKVVRKARGGRRS